MSSCVKINLFKCGLYRPVFSVFSIEFRRNYGREKLQFLHCLMKLNRLCFKKHFQLDMRSILSIILNALLMVLVILTNCIAQKKKDSSHFPTYEEIRGNKNEIIDYVAPRKASNDYGQVITETMILDKYWNAFNYSADSTVYYLNGKQVKSQKDAKKELDERSVKIERVAIGAVRLNGKRDVEIDYQLKPKK
jgi:hypothetical protein